ncbi:hypothetical protein ACFSDG_01015 [Pseudarcicella hirudinis]
MALSLILVSSCKKDEVSDNKLADEKKLEQMGADIQDFAKNKACSGDDCKVIAMGAKACGGPSSFLIYSVSKVDEKVLTDKVKAYSDFEKVINERYNRISNCAMIAIPQVDCVNGICTQK